MLAVLLLMLLIAVLVLRMGKTEERLPDDTVPVQNPDVEQLVQDHAAAGAKEVSRTDIKEKLVDPILAYYPGTAGSSLKRAVAATNVLAFAAEYGACDVSVVPELFGTEEEIKRFSENLLTITDLLKETEDDFDTISGLYEDAGVYEQIRELAADPEVWNSLHELIENLSAF